MKHSIAITLILLSLFFITQLIGLFVVDQYRPETIQVMNSSGDLVNQTTHGLPYGTEPPPDVEPSPSMFGAIVFALVIGVVIMLLLMKYQVETFLRIWFFTVVTLAIGISLTAIFSKFIPNPSIIALIAALPLAYFKVFHRNIIIHNITELAIYPGIAAILVPYLNIWLAVALLIFISLYDMYAVWHAKFMQKMAKYQIEQLKVFGGFFVPYSGKQAKTAITTEAKTKKKSNKTQKVNVAILGGGDVVFPIILAGVVLLARGLIPALVISLTATLSLGLLFYFSEKGKFYPAMPFISTGCLLGLLIALFI